MKSPAGLRFLHIADIHLGCRQYHSKERERDFYVAFDSAVERFALPLEENGPPQVDFVILPGDLFDSRNLQPITLSRATDVLSRLKEANIPVFACEGNHDAARRHESGEPNWYHFLCAEGFLIYLRDTIEDGQITLEPWCEESRSGGYYDTSEGIRVIGSQWYGAQAHVMLPRLTEAIASLPPAQFSILMFHGGLTDYVNTLSAGLEYEQCLSLRPYVQYLALGHIHKRYERQNWLFNPGSLEATKIREYFEEHGAYKIEIDDQLQCQATHLRDYTQRPFLWLEFNCDLYNTPETLSQALRQMVSEQGVLRVQQLQQQWPIGLEFVPPICHIQFTGTLNFPFSEIRLQDLQDWIGQTLKAWMVRHQNDTIPRELGCDDALPLQDGRIDRDALEQRIFASLLREDSRTQPYAAPLASLAASLKTQLLQEQFDLSQHDAFVQKISEILGSDPNEQRKIPDLDPQNTTHPPSEQHCESDRKYNDSSEETETLQKRA